MTRLLKTMLLWLLVAALPVQGWAAACKSSCGPAHPSSAALLVMTQHDHANHHTQQSFPDQHHQHALHEPGDTLDAAVSDASNWADEHTVAQTENSSSFCSACSVSSIGAAAPSPDLNWKPVHASTVANLTGPAVSFIGFIPPGLERPPRTPSI